MHIIGYILVFSLGILAGAFLSFDWQKLSAVGSIISGLGAFLASCAALFLGLYYNRENLEISVSEDKKIMSLILQVRNKSWNVIYPQYVRAVDAASNDDGVAIINPKDTIAWEKFEAFETKEPLIISHEKIQNLFTDSDKKSVFIEVRTNSGKSFRQVVPQAFFDE